MLEFCMRQQRTIPMADCPNGGWPPTADGPSGGRPQRPSQRRTTPTAGNPTTDDPNDRQPQRRITPSVLTDYFLDASLLFNCYPFGLVSDLPFRLPLFGASRFAVQVCCLFDNSNPQQSLSLSLTTTLPQSNNVWAASLKNIDFLRNSSCTSHPGWINLQLYVQTSWQYAPVPI